MSAAETYEETERTKLKRARDRGRFDRETVHAILDEGFVCHVAFDFEGSPRIIPFVYARSGDFLYLHGSTANRVLRSLRSGAEACVSVTHVDGLVLARSAFHHSVNYRSVVIFARAAEVTDHDEKTEALRLTVEHAIPGRYAQVRSPNREEFARTLVLKLPIDEVSAKVRSGAPIDDESDYDWPVWAGVLPLAIRTGDAVPDERLDSGVALPDHLREWTRPGRG